MKFRMIFLTSLVLGVIAISFYANTRSLFGFVVPDFVSSLLMQ